MMFQDLTRDFRRCGPTFAARVRESLMNPGMWAVYGYRFRRWAATRRWPRPLRWPLTGAACVAQVGAEVLTGVQLSAAARIGPGLYLPHSGTIVVGTGSVVGANCTLCHGVTLGHGGGGRDRGRDGSPALGDRVYVGPNSVLIGPVAVGDDALVGAGAVVTRPVPTRAVVAGNPARVRSRGGSFALIEYPGMEADEARKTSLAEAAREASGASLTDTELVGQS